MNHIVEVCVDSVESAIAAQLGGADRLELCGHLVIGGVTPSIKLYEEVRKHTNIKIHVLIRPRFGDFCYSKHECTIILEEIRMFREAGADGVVIGALSPDGNLDVKVMEDFIKEAGNMSITLHRAFDVCVDPMKTLEEAKKLGVHTILTSGQENNCLLGKDLLRELVIEAKGQIDILIGAGVSPDIMDTLYKETKATSYHLSGKKVIDSRMTYRNPKVSMGLPGFPEYDIYQTDEDVIRKADSILEQL